MVWQDPAGQGIEIDSMIEHHVHEVNIEPHHAQPPTIERLQSQGMTGGKAIEVGKFIRDDHRGFGARHPSHLAEGPSVVAKVVEPADGIHRVE